jgi:Tol biopolymer transport system component
MANNKDDEEPSYSPDGKKIAYTVYNDSQGDIYTINAFGGGKDPSYQHRQRGRKRTFLGEPSVAASAAGEAIGLEV